MSCKPLPEERILQNVAAWGGRRAMGGKGVNAVPDRVGITPEPGECCCGRRRHAFQECVAWERQIAQDGIGLIPISVDNECRQPGQAG